MRVFIKVLKFDEYGNTDKPRTKVLYSNVFYL